MNNKILAGYLAIAGCMFAADARSFYAGGTKADGSPRSTTYVVKEGDTLFHVAEQVMGSAYAAEKLAALNNIKDPLHLKPGTTLQVPTMGKLSIMYSMERLVDGDLVEHDIEQPLRTGDRFFVRMASNMPGYLYAFNRLPNGEIQRVFPSGNRHVKIDQFTEYLLPGKDWFELDNQRGDEELWIVVSAAKLDDLEGAVVGSDAVSGEGKARLQAYMKRNPSAKGIRVVNPEDDEDGTVVTATGSGDSLVLVHQIPIRRN